MNIIQCELPGLILFEPRAFGDERGFFMETWRQDRYREAGICEEFVQDNLSLSRRGVLRGLHFQHPNDQGKLVGCLQGAIFDVAVDIRRGSPDFGRAYGVELSAENRRQLYIPPGFAHGFCVVSDQALFSYKCTDYYAPAQEGTVLWNDPALGIDWPVDVPELSPKDRAGLCLKDIPVDRLPPYPSAVSPSETLARPYPDREQP